MAKIEKTQTEVTLSSETKRYLRNLTKALEKVAQGMAMYRIQDPQEGTKRLIEPMALSPETVRRIVEVSNPRKMCNDPYCEASPCKM